VSNDDDKTSGAVFDFNSERTKRIADKYIASDGSDPSADGGMSDQKFYALEETYYVELARRQYTKDYPKEAAFRSWCARVKREFTHKLAPTQRESIEQICRICNANPLPSLAEYLQDQREIMDHRGDLLWRHDLSVHLSGFRPHSSYWRGPRLSSKDQRYVSIWRRIRNDWGTVASNTFEHDLEHDYQHDLMKRAHRTPIAEIMTKQLGVSDAPSATMKRRKL
jgi:hypothetical protein